MVREETFRRVMGHFATGVTVVASRNSEGEAVGLTVNAFTSVSLDPPLVLICIHQDADAHDPLIEAGHFALSFLKSDQGELALRFSTEDPDQRFLDLDVGEGCLGSPILPDALAWMECRANQVFPGGDHSIILGEVVECASHQGDPLIFFRGSLMGAES
jgi:flavin reductase (DIM6/NTAB) family NADH-FMN oxidoreductase RutF